MARWQTADGRTMDVAEMTDAHLCNTLNMISRLAFIAMMCQPPGRRKGGWREHLKDKAVIFGHLEAEARKRGLAWFNVTDHRYFGPPLQDGHTDSSAAPARPSITDRITCLVSRRNRKVHI